LKRFEIALKKTIDKDKKSEIIVAHKMTIQALEENCD
jgi:hypothetical protein